MRLDGAKHVGVAEDGSLRVEMPRGVATFSRPVAWQDDERGVGAAWSVDADGAVGVALGAHDAARVVHVDPAIAYETYIGGSEDETPAGAGFDARSRAARPSAPAR